MRLRALVCLVGVAVLAGCRVDTTVRVTVREDGSGRVTARVVLDADAVRAAEIGGGKLEDRVRLGDLETAGWRSSGWVRPRPGGAVLTVSKSFARAGEAGALVAELEGPNGPLRAVRLERHASTFETSWELTGVADLRDLKTGIVTDPELLAKLTAERVDVAALDQRLLAQVRDGFRLRVVADLPRAGRRVWTVRPGARVVVRERSSAFASGKVVLVAAGIVVLLLAFVLAALGEWRGHRRRRHGFT